MNETKLANDDIIDISNYFWFGNNRKNTHIHAPTASGGVGLLVRDTFAENYKFEEIDKTYTDIIAMKFTHKISEFCFVVISGYLPPENSPWGRDAFSFFNHILQLIYMYHEVDALFIMGDFNARIGDLSDFDEAIDKLTQRIPNVDNKINMHGRGFIEFLLDAKCCVLNGRVTPEKSNKFTFQSTRGLSQVDYVVTMHDNLALCNTMNIKSCTEIINNLNLEQLVAPTSRIPDHSLLTLDLSLSFHVLEGIDDENAAPTNADVNKQQKNKYIVRNIPQEFLQSPGVCTALHNIINKIECNRETQNDVDNIYNELIDVIIQEMNSVLLVPSSKHTKKRFKIRKPYWNDDLAAAWKLMQESEKQFNKCHGTRRDKLRAKAKFNECTYNFDKLLKNYKRLYDRGYLIKIEKLNTGNPVEFWNHISQLGPRSKNSIPMETLLDDGSVTRNKSEVINKWVNDFQTLYSNESESYDDNFLLKCKSDLIVKEQHILDPLYTHDMILNNNVEMGEIERVLAHAKNKKSAGLDQIPYEIWKNGGLKNIIMKLFQFLLDVGKIPSAWTQAIIAPIPKSSKSDRRLPLSYRGISLLDCIYKLYSSFLNNRLQNYITERSVLSDEQNGFRESRSCEDHIYVLDTVVNSRLSQNKSVFACFVDFSKAFDLINRDQLMLQLLNKKIDGKFYWSLKSIYLDTSSCLKINGEFTDFFNIPNGVRQGDPLSPTLFSLFLDDLIKELKAQNLGIDIEGLILTVLAYADDLVLLADSEDKLQKLMDVLTHWCQKWRLSINNSKSGVVHFRRPRSKQTEVKFALAGNVVEVMAQYKYLGVIMDEHLTYKPATKILANAGGRALGGIISKFKSLKDIGYDTYTKLFDNCVIPILEYGAGVWAPNEKYPEIDNIMHRACRYYLGVHRYAPIPGIMGDMGWAPNRIRRQIVACRLWNRLIRMDDSRLTKQVFLYDIRVHAKFTKYISEICDTYDLDQCFSQQTQIDLPSLKAKAMLGYVDKWREEVNSKPKLRVYKEMKTDYKVENYVKSFLPKKRRSLIAQTRFSILPIRVETGRFVAEPLEARLCNLCDERMIEDEAHVIFYCPCYSDWRSRYLDKVNLELMTETSDNSKLKILFENHPYITGNLLEKIMQKRKTILYQ